MLPRLIGLTGNMGCGKSTVGKLLAGYDNIVVHNSDEIWKVKLADSNLQSLVTHLIGPHAYVDGKPQFGAIAQTIFSNEEKRAAFETFAALHLMDEILCRAKKQSEKIHVVENALLFEGGLFNHVPKPHEFIVVVCDEQEQLRRVLARPVGDNRPNFTRKDFDARVKHQWPQEKKVALATHVIDTHCSLSELEVRVKALHQKLVGGMS